MRPFNLLLCSLFIVTLASCQSLIFTKKQQDFAAQVSGELHGARVTLGKTATSSTSEGNFKVFQIDIEEMPTDSASRNTNLLFASSIPAYVFYRDTVADRKEYKYIYVVVKEDGKAHTSRYTTDQLRQVSSCFISLAGYIRAMKSLNNDSLRYYCITASDNQSAISSLVDAAREINEKWGPVQDFIIHGFRFEEKAGRQSIYFSTELQRTSQYQALEVWFDPSTSKVIAYDM